MTPEFVKFLGDFDAARAKAKTLVESGVQSLNNVSLENVETESVGLDWFQFSVPEMFQVTTEREAWAYWRWRTLRARVQPGEDYVLLQKIMDWYNDFLRIANNLSIPSK